LLFRLSHNVDVGRRVELGGKGYEVKKKICVAMQGSWTGVATAAEVRLM
jgi:hypothetical protein